jgi:hypothetical protein
VPIDLAHCGGKLAHPHQTRVLDPDILWMDEAFSALDIQTAFALLFGGAVGRLERHLMVWQPRSADNERL